MVDVAWPLVLVFLIWMFWILDGIWDLFLGFWIPEMIGAFQVLSGQQLNALWPWGVLICSTHISILGLVKEPSDYMFGSSG